MVDTTQTGWVEGNMILYRMTSGVGLFEWKMEEGKKSPCLDVRARVDYDVEDGYVLGKDEYRDMGEPLRGVSFWRKDLVETRMAEMYQRQIELREKGFERDVGELKGLEDDLKAMIINGEGDGAAKRKEVKKKKAVLKRFGEENAPPMKQKFHFLETRKSASFDFYMDNTPPGHVLMVPTRKMTEKEYLWSLAELGASPLYLKLGTGDGGLKVLVAGEELSWVGGARWATEKDEAGRGVDGGAECGGGPDLEED